MKSVSAATLAQLLGGEVVGDPEASVWQPAKIEDAPNGSITFLGNMQYESYLYTTEASIVLVNRDFVPKSAVKTTMILVDNVYESVAVMLEAFGQSMQPEVAQISKLAFVHETAILGSGVDVGPFAVVQAGAKIGDNTRIFAQVYIGENAEIGADCQLFPGVKVYHGCQIGARCILHSNTVIGSDGFGFAPLEDGSYRKIAQVGNVVVEDDVEMGSCTVVDRATMGSTIIRKGVKLDNLVQIAHNVEIGSHTVMAAQSAVAGSSKVGRFSQIGGQSGVTGHINLPDRLKCAAQTGIMTPPKEENVVLAGTPGMPFKDFMRSTAVFRKLPDLLKRLEELEKFVAKQQE
jgi:UDP-3-O-[3-hydroxymyristoyl] glucosamine N-acyltransferase